MNEKVGQMTRHFDDYEVEKVIYYLTTVGIKYKHKILRGVRYRDRPHSITAYATVEQQFDLCLVYENIRKSEF